jgi:hypothetical protein
MSAKLTRSHCWSRFRSAHIPGLYVTGQLPSQSMLLKAGHRNSFPGSVVAHMKTVACRLRSRSRVWPN